MKTSASIDQGESIFDNMRKGKRPDPLELCATYIAQLNLDLHLVCATKLTFSKAMRNKKGRKIRV